MADTANYGWTKPTVGGSSGTWGGLLNAALDDIDADVQIIDDAVVAAQADADAALAENLNFPPIPFAFGYVDDYNSTLLSFLRGTHPTQGNWVNWGSNTSTNSAVGQFIIPIVGLAPGMRITAFKSNGVKSASVTASQVSLHYRAVGAMDTEVEVSAGHALPGARADTETSGLTHDIVAGRHYYFKWVLTRTGTSASSTAYHLELTVTRP